MVGGDLHLQFLQICRADSFHVTLFEIPLKSDLTKTIVDIEPEVSMISDLSSPSVLLFRAVVIVSVTMALSLSERNLSTLSSTR